VRRQGWRKTVVAHAGGRQVGWSTSNRRGGGFLGVGRNLYRLVRHRRGDACGCRLPSRRASVYPFPTPLCVSGESIGLVRAAAASSSPSFLKVLLGTWRFSMLGAWWEFSEGRSGGGSSLFRRSTGVSICFSFLSFFFQARLCCGPSKLIVSCGCYINIAGRKPI
jgi:hypothetical protein